MKPKSSKHILLVDDDKDIVEVMRELLEGEGYIVDKAFNGQQALELLRSNREKPALILLDLMMPVKDGFEFREEQKRDPNLSDIPVLAMTADGNSTEKISHLDVQVMLKKPIDLDVLLETLNDFT